MKIMLARDRNVLNTKWLVFFANLLAERGHDVLIACDTFAKLGTLATGFELHPNVRVKNLNAPTSSGIKNLWRKARGKLLWPYFRFNRLIEEEKPDVIISYFPTDLYNVTRFQNHDIPIVQMVHHYPPVIFDKVLKKNRLLSSYCKKSFKKVTAFQVLMDSFIDKIDPFFEPKKVVRIANPVQQYDASEIIDLNNEKKKIIYIARIEKNIKRPHLLVEAFGRIAKDFPEWRVEIYGIHKYPAYDQEIKTIIAKYNMENQVFLMGYNDDVTAVYRSADIHAFPSSAEGFSLAIADAMALGLPHIGFKDALSVNEIIVDGHNGFLADDVDEFAQKLKTMMKDKALRVKMGRNAFEDIKAYAPKVIIDQWEELLNQVTEKKK